MDRNPGTRARHRGHSTRNQLKPAGVAAAVALLSACTTLKPLPPGDSPGELRSQLRAGDEVRVVTTSGQRLSFRIKEVGETALLGTSKGEEVRLPYEQVAVAEVSRVDAGKTVKNVLLGSLATLGAALLILVASC